MLTMKVLGRGCALHYACKVDLRRMSGRHKHWLDCDAPVDVSRFAFGWALVDGPEAIQLHPSD